MFDPTSVAPETEALNDVLGQVPALPHDIGKVREIMERAVASASPNGTPFRSDRAELVEFEPGRPPLRVIPPTAGAGSAHGVYVHAHGGGWSFGSAADHDAEFEALADATGYLVASVEYRLAPEHPFPVPLDDYAAALRSVQAGALDVTGPVVAGGESSGANLALSAVLRERDDGLETPAGLVLYYGAYDLTGTPSQRSFGTGLGVVDSESLPFFYDLYAGGAALDNPEISPLYAELAGLPPALLLVGTKDPLVDDSLFLWARLRAAGVPAQLHLAPGGAHGFNFFPIPIASDAVAAHERLLTSFVDAGDSTPLAPSVREI